jgi:hypothetical protein
MYLSTATIKNYSRDKRYTRIISVLNQAQRAQLENRATFEIKGMSSPIVLMLKNLGYQDKVINENVEMPNFTFDKDNVIEHEDQ